MNPLEERLLRWRLEVLARRPPTRSLVIEVLGDPQPKGRPRFGRHRTFTPKATLMAEDKLAWQLKRRLGGQAFLGNVAVAAIFYRRDRRRVDGDNLLKLALDAGTRAGAWIDDCQVTAHAAWVELDAEEPRTVLAIGDATSSLERELKAKPKAPARRRGGRRP